MSSLNQYPQNPYHHDQYGRPSRDYFESVPPVTNPMGALENMKDLIKKVRECNLSIRKIKNGYLVEMNDEKICAKNLIELKSEFDKIIQEFFKEEIKKEGETI